MEKKNSKCYCCEKRVLGKFIILQGHICKHFSKIAVSKSRHVAEGGAYTDGLIWTVDMMDGGYRTVENQLADIDGWCYCF